MWIFSTRETAMFIFVAIFLIAFLFNGKVRLSILNLVKCALSPKLVKAAIIFAVYALIFVVAFALTPLWKWIYLKDIIIWFVFAGIPLCFNAISADLNSGYFRKLIVAQLKLMVLVEFIISSFTFSLLAEIFLVMITTFIALLDVVAGSKEEAKSVKKLTSSLLSIIGIVIFILTIKNIIASIGNVTFVDMLVSFFIPIIYLFLFIPVAYLFAIYARYESLYMRMSFKEPKNRKTIRWHHWEVFKTCRFSYKKIDLFNQSYMIKMYVSMSDDSFRSLLADFKQSVASAK